MSDVFISYSRRDNQPPPPNENGFVTRLCAALENEGLDVWMDKQDIVPGQHFPEYIEKGIQEADFFLFVMSPSFLNSPWCVKELKRAVELQKRLIPLVRVRAPEEKIEAVGETIEMPLLPALDRIFADNDADPNGEGGFNTAIAGVIRGIRTADQAFVHAHTRLLIRALAWDEANRPDSATLRGKDLKDGEAWVENAQAWAAKDPRNTPRPTLLQCDYIAASQRAAKRRARTLTGAATTIAVVGMVLLTLVVLNVSRADAEQAVAARRAIEARSLSLSGAAESAVNQDYELALRLAIEANTIPAPPAQAQQVLSRIAYRGGSALRHLPGNGSTVTAAAWSPDGRTAVTGTFDGYIRVWDSHTFALLSEFEALDRRVGGLEFSPDGRVLLVRTSGDDIMQNALTLWDMQKGVLLHRLVGHTSHLNSAHFSPDGRYIVSSSDDDTIRLWDVTNGEEVSQATFSFTFGGLSNLGQVLFSRDGRLIYALSDLAPSKQRPLMRMWDNVTLQYRGEQALHAEGGCGVAVLSPDGQQIACSQGFTASAALRLLDVHTGTLIRSFTDVTDIVNNIAFTPDGEWLAAATARGVYLWDVKTGERLHTFHEGSNSMIALAFSPDGRFLLSDRESPSNDEATVWKASLDSGAEIARTVYEGFEYPLEVAYLPDGNRLLVTVRDHFRLLDAADQQELARYTAPGREITEVMPLSDGQTALAAYHNGTLIRWNLDSAEIIWDVSLSTASLPALSVTADGSTAVVTDTKGSILLVDTTTGSPVRAFEGFVYQATAVISPDSQYVAGESCLELAGENCAARSLKVWNAQDGTLYREHNLGRLGFAKLAFSPDSHSLVVGAAGGEMLLFDLQQAGEPRSLSGHKSSIWDLAFMPDGSQLLSTAYDQRILLWDVAAAVPVREIILPALVNDLAIAPDGRTAVGVILGPLTALDHTLLVTWRLDRTLEDLLVWIHRNRNFREPTCIERIQYSLPPCDAAGFAPSRTPYPLPTLPTPTLAPPTPTPLPTATATPQPTVVALAPEQPAQAPFAPLYQAFWSPDGTRIMAGSSDGSVRVWDAVTGTLLHTFSGHDTQGLSARGRWSPDGSRLVTINQNNAARVWDTRTGELIATLAGHVEQIGAVRWSPDGAFILTASDDGSARIWDAATGQQVLIISGHTAAVWTANWSSDGNRVTTASEDYTAKVWDARTGSELFSLKPRPVGPFEWMGNAGVVYDAAFSPDNRRLVTTTQAGTAEVWDMQTGQSLGQYIFEGAAERFGYFIVGARWSNDNRRVLLHAMDTNPVVWDTQTGEASYTLQGHQDYIFAAFWSPDDSRILTAGADGTIKVWDAANGQLTLSLEHRANVSSAVWSPDGRLIASTGEDGTLRLWDAQSGREQAFLFPPAAGIASRVSPVAPGIEAAQMAILNEMVETIAPMLTEVPGGTARLGQNEGELQAGIPARWQYNGVAGEVVTLRLEASIAAVLRVLAPDETEIASTELPAEGGSTGSLELTLPANGVYTFEVSSASAGSYVLIVESKL